MRQTAVFILSLMLAFASHAQETAVVHGHVYDEEGQPLELVNVAVPGSDKGTVTDAHGKYELLIPANREVRVAFRFVGYAISEQVFKLSGGERATADVRMQRSTKEMGEYEVSSERTRSSTMHTIDPKVISYIPTPSGNFEAVLMSQPGVSSSNELSSTYSVRGGNFDENLVYVNGIEIYRPFLVHSGEQEGLSFINSDLVANIEFSSGGFDARYGDKMSSVLDITYKEPKEFGGTVSASLLGGAVHLEDASKNYRFTQIHGLRYKSNQYVLNSLDVGGDYRPVFVDYQGYFTYDISDVLQVDFLGNYSMNKYRFIPESRETEFGNINQALRLTVYFDGQEIDKFETYTGALSFNYRPRKNLKLQFIGSAYRTLEDETFDIMGQYWLDELERDLSKDNFGDVAFNRGVGTYLNHGRNYLDATVFTAYHNGLWQGRRSRWLWGLRGQHEIINDMIKEWEMLDSAGYSLPHPQDSIGYASSAEHPQQQVQVHSYLASANGIESSRLMGYLQRNNTWRSKDTAEFSLHAGLRFNFWDFSSQLLISPRATVSYKPNWKKDYLFRFSSGLYSQPPFYKELRDLNGVINPDIKAQNSMHLVLGMDHNFTAWGRPFKLLTELYYKRMYDLIPYEVDVVRIDYYATNNARGFAYGIDSKVNGEFVKGVESWLSVSVMQTKEDILNDYYYDYYNSDGEPIILGYTANDIAVDSVRHEPGYIPRPTDQRVNVGLFFQDYLPKHPNYKMHLNLLYGSGLPFGPPSFERYKDTLRIPAYKRVDIGFSFLLKGEKSKLKERNPFRHFKTIWLTAEVFNLLQVNNTVSYIWIKDVTDRLYGVPNYLTARRLNLRLVVSF